MSLRTLRERFEALSPREREIMIQVVQGRLSKQIAFDIGVSETTVKVHRSHLMRKMKAGLLPELGRIADTGRSPAKQATPLGLSHTRPSVTSMCWNTSVTGNLACWLCEVSSASGARAAI
jgi:Bacterial regulatory proteins, luxR family